MNYKELRERIESDPELHRLYDNDPVFRDTVNRIHIGVNSDEALLDAIKVLEWQKKTYFEEVIRLKELSTEPLIPNESP